MQYYKLTRTMRSVLQCYACEADNRAHCMETDVMQVLPKERSINLTSCNEGKSRFNGKGELSNVKVYAGVLASYSLSFNIG